MDGRKYINRAPTGMPSSPYADHDNRLISPSQPAYYPPPVYSFAPSQTFGRSSYPEPSTGGSSPYPRGFAPAYQPSAMRPQPPPAFVANSQHPFQLTWSNQWESTYAPPTEYVNPVVFAQPGPYYQQLPARSEPLPVLDMVEGLFGDAAPRYIYVSGTQNALDELRDAINVENLMVDGHAQLCNDAFIASLRHLQDKGAIADPDMEYPGRGRFTLHEMSWTERQGLGIDRSDFQIDPSESVQHYGSPPFQGSIDNLLGFLRVMAKYHDYSHGTSYQLGIVTKTGYGDYTAQIFKAQEDKEVGATVWIYRECIGDYTSADRWTERWHAFIRRPDAPPPVEQSSAGSAAFLFPRLYQNNPSQFEEGREDDSAGNAPSSKGKRRDTAPAGRGRGRPKTTTQRNSMPATQPMLGLSSPNHGIPDRSRWPGARHQQDNAHQFQHLTDDEILTGSVHPDDIVGTLMLRLVPTHSNTVLHQKINALYHTLDPKGKTVSASSITKRWTLALQHICKRDGLDRQAQMDRYHGMRQANGILGGTGVGEGPPATKKRKASNMKAEEDDVDFKREYSLDAEFEAEDEVSTTPATKPRTRGRRARKQINYATAFDQLEDLEEDGELDSEGEEVRPAKRKKRVSVHDEDGSDFGEEGIKNEQ